MREYKFRAWDKKLEKMFYSDECYFTFQEGKLIERDGENSDYIFCRNDVVMQYTGLKDENGKEIYEGDIYRVLDRDWYDYDEDAAICEIIFEEGKFKFKRIKGGHQFQEDINRSCGRDRIEYLGNKYENPELLKEG